MTEETRPAGSASAFTLDALSAVTRKERLYLLGTSAIGMTIVYTGLIPTRIAALGITLAEADRRSLLFIFALVIAYFLVAFTSYALADFIEWRYAQVSVLIEEEGDTAWSTPIFLARLVVDFLVPWGVGVFATAALLLRAL